MRSTADTIYIYCNFRPAMYQFLLGERRQSGMQSMHKAFSDDHVMPGMKPGTARLLIRVLPTRPTAPKDITLHVQHITIVIAVKYRRVVESGVGYSIDRLIALVLGGAL